MKFPTPLVIAASFALASCGGADDEPAPDPVADPAPETGESVAPVDPTHSPPAPDQAFDDGMAYHFKTGERGPALSYGVPDTDNVALSLRCPQNAANGAVTVSFTRPAGIVKSRPQTLTLSSGDAQQSLAVETRSSQLGTSVVAQTGTDGAVMRAYRDGSPLKVSHGDETIRIPGQDDQDRIAQFFEACR